jgi:hypothetical protein
LVNITYDQKGVSNIAFANGQRFHFSPIYGEGPGRPATDMEIVDDKGVKTSTRLQ